MVGARQQALREKLEKERREIERRSRKAKERKRKKVGEREKHRGKKTNKSMSVILFIKNCQYN
jgi:hypothetical protein